MRRKGRRLTFSQPGQYRNGPGASRGRFRLRAALATTAALLIVSLAPRSQAAPLLPPIAVDWTSDAGCLTAAIYYEAALEPRAGQEAVAQVVLNRTRHPAYPSTVCGVVRQGASRRTGCQFTFNCDGSLRRRPVAALWNAAADVARMALSGSAPDHVGAATHYHANYVSPYWSAKLVRVSRIGTHVFYRMGSVGAARALPEARPLPQMPVKSRTFSVWGLDVAIVEPR